MSELVRRGIALRSFSSPEDIEVQSFSIIDEESEGYIASFGAAWPVARRILHAAGDISIARDLVITESAVHAGVAALRRGATIYTDTEMMRSGIPLRRLRGFGCEVKSLQSLPGLAEAAASSGLTRAAAGVRLLGKELAGSIFAVGNSPTALLALFDYLEEGGLPPALVIGMPVGFVNAEESKEILLTFREQPSLVLRGRRGGSPLAAATVNALAVLAGQEEL